MKNCDFEEQYEITPIKKQLSIYQDEHYISLNDVPEDDIPKKLSIFKVSILMKMYMFHIVYA